METLRQPKLLEMVSLDLFIYKALKSQGPSQTDRQITGSFPLHRCRLLYVIS